MTEIKSASDEEMAYSAKGNSDGNNGGLPQQGQAPQAAPKPYMTFAAGQVQQPSGIAGISFDFNYGARVTVPQGEYRVRFIDRKACLLSTTHLPAAFWLPAAKSILSIFVSKYTKKIK